MLSDYDGVNPQQDAIVVDVGAYQNPIYIPSNLLQVLPGNRYCGALDDQQQQTMIATACRPAMQTGTQSNAQRSNKSLISNVGLPLLGIAAPLYSRHLVRNRRSSNTILPFMLMDIPGAKLRHSHRTQDA